MSTTTPRVSLRLSFLTGLVLAVALAFTACDETATLSSIPSATAEAGSNDNPVASDGSCVYRNRVFDDDVTLPEGADCTFTDVDVQGNIQLERDARLTATDIDVDGNIQAQEARALTVTGSRVLGNIQFEQGGSVDVRTTFIDGSLQLESNDGALNAERNEIAGDLQAFQNRGGPFTFSRNEIDGNLQCKENRPAPTGSSNVVGGNREDQCREF